MADLAQDTYRGEVLVTGASGFIGSECVRQLIGAGSRPRAMVRLRGPTAKGAETVKAALAAPGPALDGIRAVIHTAYDVRDSGQRNLADFERFLAAMSNAGVETLVHLSSIVVHDGWPHGNLSPASPITSTGETASYRGAKIAIEQRIETAVAGGALARAVILRPTLVYGPGSWMWTAETVRRLRRGPICLPDAPEDSADGQPFGLCHIVHTEDLARATIRAASSAGDGLTRHIVSDPAPPTWDAFYRAHATIIGTGSVRHVPYDDLAAMLPAPPDPAGSHGPSLGARLSASARRLIGHDSVDAIANRLRALSPQPQGEQIPDRFLFDLYTSTGKLDVTSAERDLGFTTAKPLDLRLSDMSDHLRRIR